MSKNILLVGFVAAPPEWRERMGKMREAFEKAGCNVRKANAPAGWAWATIKWGERPEGNEDKHVAYLPKDYERVKALYLRLKAPQQVACPKCAGVGKFAWISSYTKELVKGKCYACKGTGKVVN